jgi:hypothetical protein
MTDVLDDDAETIPVSVIVLRLARCLAAGKLLALADIELNVGGLSIEIRGVQVLRKGVDSVRVAMPGGRGTDGLMVPATVLPAELHRVVLNRVLDEFNSMARMPFVPGAM